MGPVEKELRAWEHRQPFLYSWVWRWVSHDSFVVCREACWSLGIPLEHNAELLPDILSEAIEAAAALGL